jgi:hypothetical protein
VADDGEFQWVAHIASRSPDAIRERALRCLDLPDYIRATVLAP